MFEIDHAFGNREIAEATISQPEDALHDEVETLGRAETAIRNDDARQKSEGSLPLLPIVLFDSSLAELAASKLRGLLGPSAQRDDNPQPPKPDACNNARTFAELFERNYTRLDSDRDGFVSEKEINRAMEDKTYTGEDAAIVSVLKKYHKELAGIYDESISGRSGVTMNDIFGLTRTRRREGLDSELVAGVEAMMEFARERLTGAGCRDLYADCGDPLKSITPEAIKQGSVGNCYFLAALGSVAAVNPGAIKDMIKDNANGTFTVTFPGKDPITVDAPTEAEMGLYTAGSGKGIWPAVMAKAYGSYCGGADVPEEATDGGSILHAGLRILTGRAVNSDHNTFTSLESVHTSLSTALEQKQPVTAYINAELLSLFGLADNQSDAAGLPCGHEYSVLAYNPETRTITLRNPWGSGEPLGPDGNALDDANDGVFRLSLEEFARNFSGLAYSQ